MGVLPTREERVKATQIKFAGLLDIFLKELDNIPLADGVDRNSWLFAGCRQDIDKARDRIRKYIERCLK